MLQGIITRLASNSASCKTWCVSLTSALAVVAAQSAKVQLLTIATLPIVLFLGLDAYYLGLERRFRACYEGFITKLNEGSANIKDVFLIAPRLPVRGLFTEALGAVLSFSIWPFYLGLAVILWILGAGILRGNG
jgi:hypothetical protein